MIKEPMTKLRILIKPIETHFVVNLKFCNDVIDKRKMEVDNEVTVKEVELFVSFIERNDEVIPPTFEGSFTTKQLVTAFEIEGESDDDILSIHNSKNSEYNIEMPIFSYP